MNGAKEATQGGRGGRYGGAYEECPRPVSLNGDSFVR